MIRKHKKYSRPKKLYDSVRIQDENKIVAKYGLKNKREIWKANSKIAYFRTRAKFLIRADSEEQQIFFNKLNSIGLNVSSIAEVLALNTEDLLKRRLSTVVHKKGFANSPKQARQIIVHKKIVVGEKVINIPGYFVKVSEEDSLSIRKRLLKPKELEAQKSGEKIIGVSNEN